MPFILSSGKQRKMKRVLQPGLRLMAGAVCTKVKTLLACRM
ncbi:hypothetical protein [Salipiger pallidus]|nr:hypothetical protein [Salipiger pallidus]